MTKAEDAVALFQQGFNCTQSILSVFAADFGLDRHKARRISQGFGAGMGRTDNICGLPLSGDHADRTTVRRHTTGGYCSERKNLRNGP